MAKRTPPLYAKGLYTVTAPWQLTPSTIYVCRAIRSFDDLYELGKDVYKTFYQPMVGTAPFTTEQDAIDAFESDRDEQAAIITLMTEDNTETVYIPDTYIANYPGMNNYNYNRIVLSVDLGMVPDYLDMSVMKSDISDMVLNTLGVTNTAREHRSPTKGSVTPTQHASMEATRQGNITITETADQRAIRLQAEKDALQQEVDALLQILADTGYDQTP